MQIHHAHRHAVMTQTHSGHEKLYKKEAFHTNWMKLDDKMILLSMSGLKVGWQTNHTVYCIPLSGISIY